jgi:hypothetical protein
VKKPKGPPPTKDPAQSAIFLKAAKGLEVDESGKSFEQAMTAISSALPRKSPARKRTT